MNRKICLFLSFLLMLSVFLSGCGFENEELIGIYDCAAISLDGESFDVAEVYADDSGRILNVEYMKNAF